MLKFSRQSLRWCAFIALFVMGAVSIACGPQPANTTVGTEVNSAANAQPPAATPATPSPTPEERTSEIQFTLPLLDALLSDEQFLSEARTNVSLTDEELDRLKDVSRKAVSELSEDGN